MDWDRPVVRLRFRAGRFFPGTWHSQLRLTVVLLLLHVSPTVHQTHGAPTLDGFFPAGAPPGTSVVTSVGSIGTWPPKVWVSTPGVLFTAQTNKGKFLVSVARDAVKGPCLVRLYDEEGSSEPRVFIVDARDGIADTEPNNHFAKAQNLPELPITIDGRLDKSGDVDSFAIELKAGQWLEASVKSHVLMSKVDAALRLVTTNGVQIAWNHDFITLDPRLGWRSPSNQTVVLQIFGFAYPPGSEIRLAGGEAAIYRIDLRSSDRPPEVCAGGNSAELGCEGNQSSNVELPLSTYGRINGADDLGRHRFAASKGDLIEARVEAASLGSPLDAWIKIQDEGGNDLARNDDDGTNLDPRLEWKAGTNGTFNLVVGSVTHRGGESFCYRLSVRRVAPSFEAVLATSSLILNTGETNAVKCDIKRLRGHTNELMASVRGLPNCVTALSTNLPGKDGTFMIQFSASAEQCQFEGPIRIQVNDKVTGEETAMAFKLTARGEAAYPRLLLESSEDFWLTVRSKSPKAKPAKEKQ